MKFVTAVAEWFEYKAMRWTSEVHREDMLFFKRAWVELWGGRDIADIKVLDIERRFRARVAEGLSAGRVNCEGIALRSLFAYAKKHGWVAESPCSTWATLSYTVEKEPVCLTAEDERRIFEQMEPWFRRFCTFCLYTGLRQGTVRALRWRDLSEEGILTVPAKKIKTKRVLCVPVCPLAAEALGARPERDGLLFPELQEVSRPAVWRMFKKAVRRAKVKCRPSPHDLRKSFATRLLDRGVPIPVVMRLGGWSAQSTIFKHYLSRLDEQTAREALGKLEAV